MALMTETAPDASASDQTAAFAEHGDALRLRIERVAELLPAQGPITAFAFVNTLQALENLPFDEGLKRGSHLYKCQPYLSEDRYRQELACGRIRQEDLVEVLINDLRNDADSLVGRLGTRFHLRLAMLEHPLRLAPAAELRWVIAETDALVRFRPEARPKVRVELLHETRRWLLEEYLGGEPLRDSGARAVVEQLLNRFGRPDRTEWSAARWEEFCLHLLWEVCRQGVHGAPPAPEHHNAWPRPRDVLLELTGEDPDLRVHEVLIRFCAVYLDQGQADWPLANNSRRLWEAFQQYYSQTRALTPRWMRPLADELQQISAAGMEPLEVIADVLREFGITPAQEDEFLAVTLLALRGWAGMIWQMETRPDRVPFPVEPGTLIEFLAIRLLLDRLAAKSVAAHSLGDRGPLRDLKSRHAGKLTPRHGHNLEQRAFLVFQLAQVRGWHPDFLLELSKTEWRELVREIDTFSGIERRRIYHHAYELSYQSAALDAIMVRTQHPPLVPTNPKFQAVFCLDAREESFRRHLEDVEPQAETFGNAGFFNVPIQYRGANDAHYSTLCPIVVRPQHWVVEDVAFTEEEHHRRRALIRRTFGTATRNFQAGTRSFASGAVLSAGVGVLASIPMVMSVLFPRLTSRLQSSARRWMAPPLVTRLRLQRVTETAGPNNGSIGLTLTEMVAMGERALRDTGMTQRFARLVFILGHGSECLNNPHKSAYDCGACSGNPGGPNARALASLLNNVAVRSQLASRGIEIPGETVFIGGLHNTCNDTIEYFDLDLLPFSHIDDFRHAKEKLEQACARNAHERCRRFHSAPAQLTIGEAVRIVQQRSEDLAETRPEYGNCTNALCVVGRRGRTRGLYLDRRSFLMSYDPEQDDGEFTILGRILGAVVPVCSGINLQYTLSHIDSPGWGCGTKLPHNVTSLLGVMDGAASDLRPGLPWQGVDIHEPMRLTFVIESVPEAIRKIMSRSVVVRQIIENAWVHLALMDPATGALSVYRNDDFVRYQPRTSSLPQVASWDSWYSGCREHLGFALNAAVTSTETP